MRGPRSLYRRGSGESDGGFLFLGEGVLMRGMYRESAGMRGVVQKVDVGWG